MLPASFRAWVPRLALAFSLLAVACSRQDMSPSGSISGTMAPLVGVGSLLKATATAANGTQYTANPNPQTGAFTFSSLPPGTYVVKFSTTAAPDFPYWVTTTVAAGATATPPIPPITHDKIGRGTMKWLLNGKAYAATEFIKVYGEGDYCNIWGRTGSFGAVAEVGDMELILPKQNSDGTEFAGAGAYLLGGPGGVTPFGSYYYYGTNAQPIFFTRYTSPTASKPSGRVDLTRYDAGQGIAVGTFTFDATWQSGVTVAGAPPQLAVTQGEFNITF